MKGNRPLPFVLSATPQAPAEAREDFELTPLRPVPVNGAGARPDDSARPPRARDGDLPPLDVQFQEGGAAGPRGWPIYLVAAAVSALWALAPVLYVFVYRHTVLPPESDSVTLAVLGLMAAGPVALVWICAYLVQQARRLAAETFRARSLAESLLA